MDVLKYIDPKRFIDLIDPKIQLIKMDVSILINALFENTLI